MSTKNNKPKTSQEDKYLFAIESIDHCKNSDSFKGYAEFHSSLSPDHYMKKLTKYMSTVNIPRAARRSILKIAKADTATWAKENRV